VINLPNVLDVIRKISINTRKDHIKNIIVRAENNSLTLFSGILYYIYKRKGKYV